MGPVDVTIDELSVHFYDFSSFTTGKTFTHSSMAMNQRNLGRIFPLEH